MIPKALFLTFLSWRSAETPADSSTALTQNSNLGYSQFSLNREANPPYHVATQSVSELEEVVVQVGEVQSVPSKTENFDDLNPGDWNPDTIVDNTFKLLSSTKERIDNCKDAFPQIPCDHKHVWATYPKGSRLYLQFVDGEHYHSTVTFAWVVNDKLVPADYHVYWFYRSRPSVQLHGETKAGWNTLSVNNEIYTGIEFEVHGGAPDGILLVGNFTYDLTRPSGNSIGLSGKCDL
ncbi:MAG: hypothetical protein Q9167_007431 [Letrouitia subvulpina]